MLQPVASPTVRLADAVFGRLADAIVGGSLGPGERLRDAELARTMGVSRMPVREALQRLERIGLVEMSPSRYTRVTEVTDKLAADTRAFAGEYAAITMRMTLPRMTADQRDAAAVRIDEIVAEVENGAATVATRRAMYRLLVELSGNEFVQTVARDADLAIARNLQGLALPLDGPGELAENYRALREAVRAGDADEAEILVRAQYGI
ncbi:GntR family transcriptional regulator [Microbacterium sp. ZXX196]|uniref:GntR family transcriptional regulator n=1 Tax=Microbacterium sp. ZXX196 TaxID=2609291 RepID=UPI0018ACBFE5|nr:GntR family transcriptional regulator [Microbacterium sp. ZXX196]